MTIRHHDMFKRVFGIVLLANVLLFASTWAQAEELRVAVATNFKPVMEALEPLFEAQSTHELTLITGSTGKLYAQILNGAPVDVFLSADEAHPKRLVEAGEAEASSRFTYAVGQLVLWSPTKPSVGRLDLDNQDVRRLAIANPDLAPYGFAAKEVLHALDLWEAMQPKRVIGENVGQAFAFVYTGNAELGFVALSQVLSLPKEKQGVYWQPEYHLYTPIRQQAITLKRAKNKSAAEEFLGFLQSNEVRSIIQSAGYKVEG